MTAVPDFKKGLSARQPWGEQEVIPYSTDKDASWERYAEQIAERQRRSEILSKPYLKRLGETVIREVNDGTN